MLLVNVSAGANKKVNTLGWGALQIGDLRLLENSSESEGALGSNVVAANTASEGQNGNGERVGVLVGVSMGTDKKANTLGRRRT